MRKYQPSIAGSWTEGSSKTLWRISLPLLTLEKPKRAASIISGVNAFLCLISVFSIISINSSEPLPTLPMKTRISVSYSKSKYLCSLSSTNFCSTVSQNSLSYRVNIEAPSIKWNSDLTQFLSRVAIYFFTAGTMTLQNSGVLSSYALPMYENAYAIWVSVIFSPYLSKIYTN